MGALRMNLRASLYGTAFWGGILLFLAGCLAALWSNLTENPISFFPAVEEVLSSQTVRLCLPVAAALPYGAAWQEQTVTGFWRFSVSRSGRCSASAGKLVVSWLSGAGAVVLGLLLFLGIAALVLPGRDASGRLDWNYLPQTAALAGLYGVMSVLGALIYRSRIAAWFTPFLICFLLTMLQERYFPEVRLLELMNWPAWRSLIASTVLAALMLIPMERRLRA